MSILILYQISNELPLTTAQSPHYNAFSIPRPRTSGLSLSAIKSHIHPVLSKLNGGHGYHWRVRIDERPNTSHDSGANVAGGYSWWDVQDENARLPVRECTGAELKKMLKREDGSSSSGGGELQEVTKAAKGAMKYMGKAMNAVAGGTVEVDSGGERVAVIVFKLLDLSKVQKKGVVRTRAGAAVRKAQRPAAVAPAPISAGRPPPRQQVRPTTQTQKTQAVPTANLMDFNAAPSAPQPTRSNTTLSHASSMPIVSNPTNTLPNETRAEKLKREYAQKASTSNRVWDEVDQRWVEGPVQNGETKPTNNNNNNGVAETTKSLKGITLDPSNAIGKSQKVATAINARVAQMEDAKQKAISELRQREASKASEEAEEESVRIRLEPKLKAWSEEHGKKKQLRALLANLHTILWEDSGWKPISLADVLDDSKVKRWYHKASRVVHPDKTGGLDAEKRFVAKRVFDALTQAKVEFDGGVR